MQLMPSSPEVWLDEGLLRQVLENLVRNAVEAIEGDGVVRIETDVVERFFVIRVKDTGRGIPPEIQAKAVRTLLYDESARNRPRAGDVATNHF